jgi:hypothetical protein
MIFPKSPIERRLWLYIGVPMLALVAILASLAGLALGEIARREDQAFRDMTRRMVESAVAVQVNATKEQTLDYANWNDAYEATSRHWNQEWLAENYYSSVMDALIVARAGQMRFLWTEDHLTPSRGAVSRDALSIARGFDDLNALAAAPTEADTGRAALMTFNGRLAVLAIAPITPEDDAARIEAANRSEPVNVLLGVRVLAESDLVALNRALALEDFRFAPAGVSSERSAVSWRIAEMGGAGEAAFVWRDPRIGSAHLARRVWLMIAILCLLGLIASFVTHSMVMRALWDAPAKH